MSIVRANSNNTFDILSGNMDIPNLDLLLEQLERRILEKENPVGHIRMETSNVNPKEYLGFGEWQLWGSGRVPVGIDISQTEFNSVEKTGGSKDHYHDFKIGFLMNHFEIVADNMDKQGAWSYQQNKYGKASSFNDGSLTSRVNNSHVTASERDITDNIRMSVGDTTTSSNVQPYITCYMWKRLL